ncbi:MAG: aminodeoxychorismate/anthranilate synthase component II [Ignavibacteriales bacterium]|nr:aminodeoxychorismate/anthranilate synthase component II [Ignavibacteriales bacterium]
MTTKLLIIDNYDSFTYNLIQLIEENVGCEFDIAKNDKIDFNHVEYYNKILSTPGPGIPAEAGEILRLIKSYSKTKSILGICLGYQAIAEAFGGRLVQLPQVAHGVSKKIKILDERDYLFQKLPEAFEVGLYHSWAVSAESLPSCLKVTAAAEDGTIMAIAHKDFDVKGVQFHPESIMTKDGRKIISNWLKR